MPWEAYARMSAEDVGALYEFLRSLPPAGERRVTSRSRSPTRAGDLLRGARSCATMLNTSQAARLPAARTEGWEARIAEKGEAAFNLHHHRCAENERRDHQPHRDAVGHLLKAVDHRTFVDYLYLQFQLAAGERFEHAVDAPRQLFGEFLRFEHGREAPCPATGSSSSLRCIRLDAFSGSTH